jgi:predicted nucleic acid-binding protein
MVQVVFLDTNVILDYLEERDKAVKDVVERLLNLHKNGRVVLATSVFNIAESIDKEFDIHFGKWGLTQKLAFDEIQRLRRDWRKFADVSKKHRYSVKENIETFASKNGIAIYSVPAEAEQYEQLYELIYKYQRESQDALIVAAALTNRATYFLSNDAELIVKTRDVLYGYNLRDEGSRNAFLRDVLEAI